MSKLVLSIFALLMTTQVQAQQTITRGADMSVDVAKDGRLAIDLLGDLWIVPSNGGDARQLTEDLKSVQQPRWSPNGEQLVYRATVDGRRGLWIYNVNSREVSGISSDTGFDMQPAWHPAGERVIYSSDGDGSGFDLWEVDVPTGLRWRISNLAGDETEAAWSADGRDLVYIHQHENTWSLILRRHGQPEEVLLSSSDKLAAPSWRPDGSLITFFRDDENGVSIDMLILSTPRLVREFAANEVFNIAPVSWLNRQKVIYTANGQIRSRWFGAWRSSSVHFRATIQPKIEIRVEREKPVLVWYDEPTGKLIIHAARLFDGVETGYQYNKDILIKGGRIVGINPHVVHHGSIVIDMGDLTILPGFIDSDARLPAQLAASHGPDLLTMGVTTIVASHVDADELNALWSRKEIPGPRFLVAEEWPRGAIFRPELDVTSAVVSSRTTGLPAGEALTTQFRAMQIAGLTAEQTLRAIGVNAAGSMLADPYLGRVATGSAADLVFVDGDPLAKIKDALNVVAVVRNGRFYSVSGLFDRAKSAETVD
jgi:hypothetical protein